MINKLNIIHISPDMVPRGTQEYDEAVFRESNIVKQTDYVGIDIFQVWKGIIDVSLPFRGISLAHKQIVLDAKIKGFPSVTIAEDDIDFSCPESWKYYCENEPNDYDLYMGSVFDANIDENNRIVFGFSAMTLYTVHSSFYDFFLNLKEMNNIDRELGRFSHQQKYLVCNPFVCHHLGGYSYHQRKIIPDYDKYLNGRSLLGR